MIKTYLLFIGFLIAGNISNAQMFNERYILNQTAMGFQNLVSLDDTLVTVGIGNTNYQPFPSKMMVTKFDQQGEVLSYDLTKGDSLINYYPLASSKKEHELLVVGGAGLALANQWGFYANYDLNSGLQWFKEFIPEEGSNIFFVSSLSLSNGNHLLLGNKQQENSGIISSVLIHTDSEGEVLWQTEYVEPPFSYKPSKIIATSDSTFLLGLEKGNHHLPQQDFIVHTLILEVNQMGDILSEWEDSDPHTYAPRQIMTTSNQELIYVSRYLAGVSDNNWPIWQGYICRVNAQGDTVWSFKTGVPTSETDLNNLMETSDGNYIAIGNTLDSLANNQTLTQSGLIIKFTEDGVKIWEKRYYGIDSNAENNKLFDILELEDHSLILCGNSVDLFAASFPHQGWLLKLNKNGLLDSTTAVQTLSNSSEEKLKLYPNPVINYHLNLQLEHDLIQEVLVYNHLGKLFKSIQQINSYRHELDTSKWPLGSYTVLVNGRYAELFLIR